MPTDIVSVVALQLSTTVGPDCWDRKRPQPVQLTVQLHLTPHFLDAAGNTDSVTDSIHYGQLSKAVERRVVGGIRREEGYDGVHALLEDVTDAAFSFVVDSSSSAGDGRGGTTNVTAVRVVVTLPKQILLAGNMEAELTTPTTVWVAQHAHAVTTSQSIPGAPAPPHLTSTSAPISDVPRLGVIVRVTALVLPVLVGVNPPERVSKQHVITHLTFDEPAGAQEPGVNVNYSKMIKDISAAVEKTEYLTLEKLVMEIVRTAFGASEVFEAVTVCCQKPSALSFAHASAVEITRRREQVV